MTYLGIDYGESKIGLAVSDSEGQVAQAVKVVQVDKTGAHFAEILKVIKEWGATEVLAGLPLSPDGSENEASKRIKQFVEQLSKKSLKIDTFPLNAHYYPETYSTKFANLGKSRKQKQTMGDAHAAAHILQEYLNWKNTGI